MARRELRMENLQLAIEARLGGRSPEDAFREDGVCRVTVPEIERLRAGVAPSIDLLVRVLDWINLPFERLLEEVKE